MNTRSQASFAVASNDVNISLARHTRRQIGRYTEMQGRADREEAGQTGERRVASSTSPSAAALRASARSLRVEPLLRQASAQTRAKDSICQVSCQAPLWAAAAYFLAAHRDCNHRRVLAVSPSRSGSETSLSRNSCKFQWLKERHCTAPSDVRNDKLNETSGGVDTVSVRDELRICMDSRNLLHP